MIKSIQQGKKKGRLPEYAGLSNMEEAVKSYNIRKSKHKCKPLQSSEWEEDFGMVTPWLTTGERVFIVTFVNNLLSAQQQEWKEKIRVEINKLLIEPKNHTISVEDLAYNNALYDVLAILK